MVGRANRYYPNDGRISVGHRSTVLTLIGAGVNDVDRQVDIFGDIHVFGVVACSSELLAGDTN